MTAAVGLLVFAALLGLLLALPQAIAFGRYWGACAWRWFDRI